MNTENTFWEGLNDCHPGFSVDCVVVTYYKREIKILINKVNRIGQWMLPGGFVKNNEDVDDAVYRILKDRTGLKNIYLQQFHLFGAVNRTDLNINNKILESFSDDLQQMEYYKKYFVSRFITMGYFALVNFEKITLPEKYQDLCHWFSLSEIPHLYSDHNLIIEKAIQTIRQQINYLPIGSQMLPEKFILPDLRAVYEELLGKKLDRRNFQKKMISSGKIQRLDVSEDKITPYPHYYKFLQQNLSLNDIGSIDSKESSIF